MSNSIHESVCKASGWLILATLAAGLSCGKDGPTDRVDARVATWRDGGYPVACLASCDDGNSCTVDTCDLTRGQCRNDPAPDGAPCDDGDPCTLADSCRGAVCYGGAPKDCSTPPDQCHEPGFCVTTDGACSYPVSQDYKACDDQSRCTDGEYCMKGECTGISLQCRPPAACGPQDGICQDRGVSAFPSALWGMAFEGGVDAVFAPGLTVAPSGAVFLTGALVGTLDLGAGALVSAGAHDVLIARLDPESGKAKWSKRYGDRYEQLGVAIAAGGAGAVASAGAFWGTIDFAVKPPFLDKVSSAITYVVAHDGETGAELWATTLDACEGCTALGDTALRLAADGEGNFVICGPADKAIAGIADSPTGGGGLDFFVGKLSGKDGSVIWAREIGSPGDDSCEALAVDPKNNVYLTGSYGAGGALDFGSGFRLLAPSSSSQTAGFLAKLELLRGETVWATRLAPKANGALVFPKAVVSDGDSVWVGGDFAVGTTVGAISLLPLDGTAKGVRTAFVADLVAADGTAIWANRWGRSASVHSLSLGSAGDLLIAGDYVTGMSFDRGSLTDSVGAAWAFVADLTAATGKELAARGYAMAGQASSSVSALAADIPRSGSSGSATYVLGHFGASLDLGAPLAAFSSGADMRRVFLAKLAP